MKGPITRFHAPQERGGHKYIDLSTNTAVVIVAAVIVIAIAATKMVDGLTSLRVLE